MTEMHRDKLDEAHLRYDRLHSQRTRLMGIALRMLWQMPGLRLSCTALKDGTASDEKYDSRRLWRKWMRWSGRKEGDMCDLEGKHCKC